jgi:hypothetical protein
MRAFNFFGRWEEILLVIILFLLGMGTFLPFFLVLWLGLADANPAQIQEYEKLEPIETPYINPSLEPMAENIYAPECNVCIVLT